MHPMLTIAIRAARDAGNVIVKAYGDPGKTKVEQKGTNDFVTNVEKEAEAAIIATIKKAYPEHTIIAKESGATTGADTDYQWIIDPLNGHINFIKGIPHFAVSVALHVKGKAEVAVIFDAIGDEIFSACRGKGAQLNGFRLRAGSAKDLSGTVLATGFPHSMKHQQDTYMNIFGALFTECADIRASGCPALNLAYLAAGRIDGLWSMGQKPWETAAGNLIATESGAIVTDFAGGHDFFKSGNSVAASPRVLKDMLAKIRPNLTESLAK
ncbi:Inositol-1-monophosphatase [Moritella sp. JT01]|uniref:inositol-1-monophosphatase n=1 Tax=Moritella sp. JT01 TaxID=756698 RepID=UPI000795BD3C|nr:inositol-1-monophosphatase [Moritella sp. JT01]KXO07502.1 Inositol-1-monophosphatase [Moritella sp. JT01]